MKHFLENHIMLMYSLLLRFYFRVDDMTIQLSNLGQRIKVLSIHVLLI